MSVKAGKEMLTENIRGLSYMAGVWGAMPAKLAETEIGAGRVIER